MSYWLKQIIHHNLSLNVELQYHMTKLSLQSEMDRICYPSLCDLISVFLFFYNRCFHLCFRGSYLFSARDYV